MFEQTQIQEFKEVGAAVESSAWRQTPQPPPIREHLPLFHVPRRDLLLRCLYPPNNPRFGLHTRVTHLKKLFLITFASHQSKANFLLQMYKSFSEKRKENGRKHLRSFRLQTTLTNLGLLSES